ncbi:MAG: SDR family oxidoreductase [Betaproteobacteria bacterium]|nr:MAG: SDR family oxidoreductase [Betaproteobacteria bacterium]
MSTSLSGKVAVITGASSGIGLAVANELHSHGMKLVLNSRSEARLAPLESEVGATVLAGDVTSPDLPKTLLDLALSTYGQCDVVLNNAGLIEVGPIESIDIDKVCAMVRTNVEAAYRVAYTFMRHFVDRGEGHLLNTSSVLGTKVRPTAGAYAGTKYAIEALSEALRMEVAGTGVAVTCIEPGLVRTALHRDWPVQPSEALNVPNPLTPEDIARSVSFVLNQPAHVRIPRIMILPGEQQI